MNTDIAAFAIAANIGLIVLAFFQGAPTLLLVILANLTTILALTALEARP